MTTPKIITALAVLLISVSVGSVEGKEKSVALDDLATLGETGLKPLMEAHHAVAVAIIMRAGSEAAEPVAKDAVKKAKKARKATEADWKAATSEAKAAEENEDQDRLQRAKTLVSSTRSEFERAGAFLKWREQVVKVQESRTARAKAVLELREADLERTRAELVIQRIPERALKYAFRDFENRVREKQKRLDRASKKLEEEEAKGMKLEQIWEKLN